MNTLLNKYLILISLNIIPILRTSRIAELVLVGKPCSKSKVVSSSKVNILVTVIIFSVSVPVLSTQITLTDPRVSTDGNFFIIAFFFAILKIPNPKVTATTIGRPSGIAATAKLTI